jgi:hypothetical protein
VSDVLRKSGFVPIPLSNKSLYSVTRMPITPDGILTSLREGGHMIYFTNPELNSLKDTEKSELLNRVSTKLITEKPELLNKTKPYYEMLVFFKARAI